MKIDLTDIKPTLDSLLSKANPRDHGYRGVLRGSRVALLALMHIHPESKEKIRVLLENKDFDLQLEPINNAKSNMITLRPQAEKLNKKLSVNRDTVSSPKLPVAWQQYYSLPTKGIKYANKKELDLSIQANAINPCMNIDQKCDFSGEVLYLNEQYRKDFEETYLRDNLIIFYDIHNKDYKNNLTEQGRVAFRLRKCLKPEVADFNTLLVPDTAIFVQDLLENEAMASVRSKIFSKMHDHYKMDINDTKEKLKLLVENSLAPEVTRLNIIIPQQTTIVEHIILQIEHDDNQRNLLRSKLDETKSSSSQQTVQELRLKLKAIQDIKENASVLYEKSQQLAMITDGLSSIKVSKNPPSEEKTLNRPQSELPKKNKKTSPVLVSKSPDTNLANLDEILKEAKKDFGKNPAFPISMEDEYRMIIKKHETILNSVKIVCAAPEDVSEKSKGEIVYYATIIETFQRAESDQAFANLCYDLIGFYSARTQSILTENKIPTFDTNVDKKVVQEIMRPFDVLKKLHTSSDSILKCMHILMISLPFNSVTRIDRPRLHAAMKHVQNYRGSPDLNIDILLKNIFILVKDQPANPVSNATTLLVEAISADMAERLQNGKKNGKTLSVIKVLLKLEQKVATLLHCKEPGDYLDREFSESILKSFLKQSNKKDEMTELFTQCFVHSMIEAIIMGTNERADSFMHRHVLQAQVMIESYIFSANGKLRNAVLGELIKKEFESVTENIRKIHYILLASVPQLRLTPQDPYRFSNVGNHLNEKTIVSELALVSSFIRSIRDRYGEFLNPYHRLQYDAALASLAGLIASPYGIFHEKHSEMYSNTLKQSARFRVISSELVAIKNATGGIDVNVIHYDATKNPIVQGYVKCLGEAVTPQPIVPVHHDQSVAGIVIPDNSKAQKSKKVASSSSSQKNDEFDKLLDEAKTEISQYPAPKLTIENKYKALIYTHQKALNIPLNPILVPTKANASSIHELVHYSTIQEFVSESISKPELASLFFELNDFYKNAIEELKNDASVSGELPGFTEKQYNEILSKINSLKAFLKSKNSILMSMHEIMVATYLNPDDMLPKKLSENEQEIHQKVLAHLIIHRASDEQDLEGLLKKVFDIIKPDADDAIEKCVTLLQYATKADLRQILTSGEKNKNTLSSIKVLIGLKTLSSMFLHFKRKGDMLEYTFVKSITKVLIEQTSMKNRIYELFTQYFINQTIITLTERQGLGDPDHFKVMITQAGIMIVKHLFPSNAFSENAVLVSHVLTYFSPLNNKLKAHYSILLMATPSITAEKNPIFILNSPGSRSLSECAQQFAESRGAAAPHEIKGIINLTIKETQILRNQYMTSSLDDVTLSFDIALLALEILKENSHIILGKNFKDEFTQALSSHAEFMTKAHSLSLYKDKTHAKKSKAQTFESEFYIRSIMAMTESDIDNEPTMERVNHLYDKKKKNGATKAPQTPDKFQPTPK